MISHVNVDIETGTGLQAKQLRFSAAFHTNAMKPAQLMFKRALENIKISLPSDVLVYSNVTGRPYSSEEEIRRLLPSQISSPVQWYGTVLDMVEKEGITRFIECGPMDTLSKMLRIILPETEILTSDERKGK